MEGTKQFRRRSIAPIQEKAATEIPREESPRETFVESETAPDAMNLDRRSWFRALLPAAGDGLVKLLRASNNLQRDVHEVLQSASDSLVRDDPADPKK